jgi:hypothetical protein
MTRTISVSTDINGASRGTRKRIFNKVAKGAAKEPVDTNANPDCAERRSLLADVTVDYYADLERGKLDRASDSLIEALMHGLQRRRRNAGTCTTHGRRTRRQERSAVRHTRFDLPSSASSKRGSMLCRTCAATQRHLDGHRHG